MTAIHGDLALAHLCCDHIDMAAYWFELAIDQEDLVNELAFFGRLSVTEGDQKFA